MWPGHLWVLEMPLSSPNPSHITPSSSPGLRGGGTSAGVSVGLPSRQPGLPFPPVIYSFSPTSGAEAAFGSGCLRAVGWSWVKCVRPQAHREPPLLPHGVWGAAASRWGPGAGRGFREPWSILSWGFPDPSSKSLLAVGQRASGCLFAARSPGVLCLPCAAPAACGSL